MGSGQPACDILIDLLKHHFILLSQTFVTILKFV